MSITRRGFLSGFIAAPFVAKAEFLMPVRQLFVSPMMVGDLVNIDRRLWREMGISAYTGPIRAIIGDRAVISQSCGRTATVPFRYLSLFEGLRGNRVDNPSMRHKLIREPGKIGLAYPEDCGAIA